MDSMKEGDSLEIRSSDPGFYDDIGVISEKRGFEVETVYKSKGIVTARVRKK